ncbi:hypothetical protein [Paenibacillus sp. TH7-28]
MPTSMLIKSNSGLFWDQEGDFHKISGMVEGDAHVERGREEESVGG